MCHCVYNRLEHCFSTENASSAFFFFVNKKKTTHTHTHKVCQPKHFIASIMSFGNAHLRKRIRRFSTLSPKQHRTFNLLEQIDISLLLNEATLCHAKTRPEVYFECLTSIIFDYNCVYSYAH